MLCAMSSLESTHKSLYRGGAAALVKSGWMMSVALALKRSSRTALSIPGLIPGTADNADGYGMLETVNGAATTAVTTKMPESGA